MFDFWARHGSYLCTSTIIVFRLYYSNFSVTSDSPWRCSIILFQALEHSHFGCVINVKWKHKKPRCASLGMQDVYETKPYLLFWSSHSAEQIKTIDMVIGSSIQFFGMLCTLCEIHLVQGKYKKTTIRLPTFIAHFYRPLSSHSLS